MSYVTVKSAGSRIVYHMGKGWAVSVDTLTVPVDAHTVVRVTRHTDVIRSLDNGICDVTRDDIASWRYTRETERWKFSGSTVTGYDPLTGQWWEMKCSAATS